MQHGLCSDCTNKLQQYLTYAVTLAARQVKGFKFDAGPSFHAGLSVPFGKSSNPLKQACSDGSFCSLQDFWSSPKYV